MLHPETGSVVAALGKGIPPATWAVAWPELLHFMQGCAGAASAVHRELGLMLLHEQAEFVGSELHHMGDLVQPMLLAGLSARELPVQVRSWPIASID